MSDDPYENKAALGAMIRKAAGLTPINLDVERLLNITTAELLVKALADQGCMISLIPTRGMSERRAANQDWLVSRLQGIVTMVRDDTWNDDDVAYEAAAIRDQIES